MLQKETGGESLRDIFFQLEDNEKKTLLSGNTDHSIFSFRLYEDFGYFSTSF